MQARPDKTPNHAIVIGLDGMGGIQTARILAARGVPVIGIARDPDHHCCRTNVCEEIVHADTGTDDLIPALRTLGERLQQKAVLIPCHDRTVRVVSANRDELERYFHVSIAPADIIDMLTDKVGFYEHAKEQGFLLPETYVLRSKDDAVRAAAKMSYPAVLKPPASERRWDSHTMKKGFRVEDADAFLEQYERCESWAEVLLLQQWIEGGDDCLYSCNCYFDANSRPLATFVARKLRQWPPHLGLSSLGEECRNDVVLAESLRLFRGVGYRGLGYVEFKRDARDGKHYMIEPNVGRPTGRSAIAEAGGVELLYTMYCDAIGAPLPEKRVQKYVGAKWVDLRHDFQSAFYYWRKGELSIADWWRSWRGPKAHTYFSWSDPAPFLYDLAKVLKQAVSASERRKRDYLGSTQEVERHG